MSLTEYRERKRSRQAENRVEQARELAARFGARIYSHGQAWRVVGPTINVLVADLAMLREADFMPD